MLQDAPVQVVLEKVLEVVLFVETSCLIIVFLIEALKQKCLVLQILIEDGDLHFLHCFQYFFPNFVEVIFVT